MKKTILSAKRWRMLLNLWRCWMVLSFLLAGMLAQAATVDTAMTYSMAMHKAIKAVVVKPDGYGAGKETYPVVYLLHGYGGNYADWIRKVPVIKEYSDRWKLIIVCPDGNVGSWYFDSPVDSAWRYETYVGMELVAWVDTHYHTIRDRSARAITGLSMGGHGALFLAFRHQDVFGAAGSMSGGVDMRPFPKNWDIAKRLGTIEAFPDRWEQYSVINQTNLLKPGGLAISFECGSEDFFYGVNKALHEKLLAEKIPHDYACRPGGHTWEYWTNAVEYQLLYFHHFFEKIKRS